MPTEENLRNWGCVIVSVCSFCLKSEETSEHFLWCPFAVELWNWLGGKLNCVLDLSAVLSLLSCIPLHGSSQVSDMFMVVVVHTLHTIWLSRNTLHFSMRKATIHAAKVRIHSLVAMSGNSSIGNCLTSEFSFLDSFSVPPNNRRVKEIIMVLRKAPSPPRLKVNTDGSAIGGHAACGGLFRDYLGTFLGAFTCNLGISSVFHSQINGLIFAIEFAVQNGWRNIWLESDSTSALMIFSNASLVPVMLRNRWHNALHLGVQVISSHIYCEGNYCADRLANMSHLVQGPVWVASLPLELHSNFFRERCSLPNYRFP